MITHTPPAKVEPPFAFKLEIPAPAITQQSEVDAHPDTLRPAWQVQSAAREIAERIRPAMEQITNNPHLTEAGKRAEATKLALQTIPALTALRDKLEAPEAACVAKAQEVRSGAALPKPTERHERLAEAFGRKNEQQRIKLLEGAMTGRDTDLAEALAVAHPILHGLAASTVAILQSQVQGEKLDPTTAEQVKDVASKLGTVRQTVTTIIDSLESAADRAQLKSAGVATLRRSDLTTDEQRSKFIDANGLDAYKALPA